MRLSSVMFTCSLAAIMGFAPSVVAEEPWDTVNETREDGRPCDQNMFARACVHLTDVSTQTCDEFGVGFDFVIDNPLLTADTWASFGWSAGDRSESYSWSDMDQQFGGFGVPSFGLQGFLLEEITASVAEGDTMTLTAFAVNHDPRISDEDFGATTARFSLDVGCKNGVPYVVPGSVSETFALLSG